MMESSAAAGGGRLSMLTLCTKSHAIVRNPDPRQKLSMMNVVLHIASLSASITGAKVGLEASISPVLEKMRATVKQQERSDRL